VPLEGSVSVGKRVDHLYRPIGQVDENAGRPVGGVTVAEREEVHGVDLEDGGADGEVGGHRHRGQARPRHRRDVEAVELPVVDVVDVPVRGQ
jgi:hypothetical protein